MGSNAFKSWALLEPDLLSTATIGQFKGRRVGIDAEDYLHQLLITGNREPLLPALGGKPFCLWRRVDDDIEGYRSAGIEPFFIFNGLDLACKDRGSVLAESRRSSSALNEAWQIYDQGRGEEAVLQFGKACTYRSYHLVRSLQLHLHGQGVHVQTAPYLAATQLAHLESEDVIDAIQGSASCLLFGASQIVLAFDWEKESATCLFLSKCLGKLECSSEHFTNACLLSGWSFLPTFRELETEPPNMRLLSALNLVKMHVDINNYLLTKDAHYHGLYWKARFALKHPVVLTWEGEIKLVDWKKAPGDTHEFIGQRLPEELYFYLSRGLIGTRVLNWRTRMEILETPPLDGGDSSVYKDLVSQKLQPLRAQAVAILAKSLNRYYQKSDVKLVCWWHEVDPLPLGTPDMTESTKAADSWHVGSAQLSQLNVSTTSPFAYAINSLVVNAEAKKTVTPRNTTTAPLHDPKEIRTNIVWRFLHDRGYINVDHTLSAWGKALRAALNHGLDSIDDAPPANVKELEEAIFMAFELLRLSLLDRRVVFPAPPYSGGPIRGSDHDKAQIHLISRIACLGFLQHKSIGYTGPLSRNLLAYHQCTAAVRGALRDLLEVHACHMLLSGAVDRDLGNLVYTDIASSLPLVDEPDIGLALVVKCHLDELCHSGPKRNAISGWFPHAVDIEGDLNKSWKLWDAVTAGVRAAEPSIVNSEAKKTFQTADAWLKEKKEHLPELLTGTTNGTT